MKKSAVFIAGLIIGFVGCLGLGFGVCELVEMLDGDDE